MAENFENSLKELEEIVAKLEGNDTSLEESVALFEKGVKLTKTCSDMLDKAEKKVSVLMASDNGKVEKQPFASPEAGEENG